jgi:hypothetical protein
MYSGYRCVDPPSFQQCHVSDGMRPKPQLVVALDPALLVPPPPGLEVGSVRSVAGQTAAPPARVAALRPLFGTP